MKNKVSSILCLGFCAVVFLLLGGCAQNKQTIARLEQENAQQRERIWQSNRKMEDFRQENEALRQQITALQNRNVSAYGTAGNTSGTGAWSTVPNTVPSAVVPSQNPVQTIVPTVTPQPPATSLGEPAGASSMQTLSPNPPTGSNAATIGGGKKIYVTKTDSKNVHSVMILPERTHAIHYEGLHAEIQMKDAAGNIVLAPAPLVVMVTDPTKTGNEARVSKWNYSAEDIAEIINSGQAGISIPLNMAWASSCPQNLNLELHILYCTSDKRMLVHAAKINLASENVVRNGVRNTSASQGGLTLEAVNPPVAGSAGNIERPQWTPDP